MAIFSHLARLIDRPGRRLHSGLGTEFGTESKKVASITIMQAASVVLAGGDNLANVSPSFLTYVQEQHIMILFKPLDTRT